MTDVLDPGLAAYATPSQLAALEAVNLHGSISGAARALEVRRSGLQDSIRRLERSAAAQGYAPGHWTNGTAPGYRIGKVTVQRGPGGIVERTWERELPDDMLGRLKAAVEALSDDIPRLPPVPAPVQGQANLLNLYTITDAHVGMLAWRHEGGEDWDLKIAEKALFGAFEAMIAAAPAAEVGFINQLGDFLHSDGMVPVTPTSHNVLDQDGRFEKMVGIAIRLLRRMVDLALQKHNQVIVLLAEGNHDLASSVWLRVMFKALYENEPRVTVIQSALPYYAYKHGKTLLAFHHGHLTKPDALAGKVAAGFPELWGQTTRRYAHLGHQHHLYEKEHDGITVTQHPTLAARDAYAARGGWFAQRAASAITYHTEFGQVAKNTVVPEMLN